MRLVAPPEDQDIDSWADAVASAVTFTNTATVVAYEEIKSAMLHSLVRRGFVPISSTCDAIEVRKI